MGDAMSQLHHFSASFNASADESHPFDQNPPVTILFLARDGNFTRGCGYPRVPDPMGDGMGMKFYPRIWV